MMEFGYGSQQPIAKAAPMSERELAHRKRGQAALTVGTSTSALTATGLLGAGAGLKLASKGKIKKPLGSKAYLAATQRRAKMKRIGTKLSDASAPLSVATGGVGALGGYNFAAIQRAEAKKRQPVRKAYDSERSRQRRLEIYERGSRKTSQAAGYASLAALGGSAALGGATVAGNKRVRTSLRGVGRSLKAVGGSKLKGAAVLGAAGLGAGGVSIASRVGSDRIASYRSGRGRTHQQRYNQPWG